MIMSLRRLLMNVVTTDHSLMMVTNDHSIMMMVTNGDSIMTSDNDNINYDNGGDANDRKIHDNACCVMNFLLKSILIIFQIIRLLICNDILFIIHYLLVIVLVSPIVKI